VKQIGKKWVDCCVNTNENVTAHNTDNDNMAKTTREQRYTRVNV